MNVKQGLMRLWIVFTIPWSAYFGWTAYDAMDRMDYWQKQVIGSYNNIGNAAIAAEEKAKQSGGSPDYNLYSEGVKSLRIEERFNEAIKYRNHHFERLENATRLGPTVPIGFLALIWAGIWVYRGFWFRPPG